MSDGNNWTHPSLAEALVAAQADMVPVEKTAQANYGKYATLDSLISKTRPILNAHGLAIVQFPAVSELGQPVLRTILSHQSGEQMSADMPLFLPSQNMQQLGSAITYAKRYAWSAALGIAADEDDDGTHASPDNQPAATQATATSNGSSTITEPQQKRLFAIAKTHALEADVVKRLIKEIGGVDSTAAIPKAKYDAVIEAIEAESVPF